VRTGLSGASTLITQMTTIIALYGAILSTAIFVHSLWQKKG